jgi:hypothetical protein
MRPSLLRSSGMRSRSLLSLVPLSLFVIAAACGDRAGLPSPLQDDPRAFASAPCDPLPEQTGIDPTFASLYGAIFSIGGVAQCQNKACHGRLDDNDQPLGQSGLAMGSSGAVEESPGTPFGNPAGVYCGITTHVYGGRKVVNNDPATHDYVVQTDPVVTEGTEACCKLNGAGQPDPLYKATDCTGGAEVKVTATGGAGKNQNCAVATAAGTCAKAMCRTDAILKVLDRKEDPTGTRPSANDGFMPNRLPCNRPLTPQELDLIFAWLANGAKYDGFPGSPPAPTCTQEGTVCGDGIRPCD